MSRYNLAPERIQAGAPERVDVTGSGESCLRVHGGLAGAVVRNEGPCRAQTAVAVAPDEDYAKITTVKAAATQTVDPGESRDFWAPGAGRARLVVERP